MGTIGYFHSVASPKTKKELNDYISSIKTNVWFISLAASKYCKQYIKDKDFIRIKFYHACFGGFIHCYLNTSKLQSDCKYVACGYDGLFAIYYCSELKPHLYSKNYIIANISSEFVIVSNIKLSLYTFTNRVMENCNIVFPEDPDFYVYYVHANVQTLTKPALSNNKIYLTNK